MISIILPTYNREVYLVDALNSIIGQTYKDWECIVVDDGSTDHTHKIMDFYTERDKRIKYYKLPQNYGIAVARNFGIQVSKGEYIAVMDSDDVMMKDRLKKSLKVIKGKVVDKKTFTLEPLDFVYSSYYLGDENAIMQSVYMPPTHPTREDVKNNAAFPHVTILARKYAFEAIPYNYKYKTNDDARLLADWYFAGYRSKLIKEPLTIVRVHKGNVSKKQQKEIAKSTKKIQDEF